MCTASAAQLLFSFFLPNNFFLSVCTFPECVSLFAPSHRTEPVPGLEPGTSSLPRKCSTTELHRHSLLFFCRISIGLPLRNSFSSKTLFRQTDYKGSNKLSIQQQFGTKIVHRFFICSLFSAVFCLLYLLLKRINTCIYGFFK